MLAMGFRLDEARHYPWHLDQVRRLIPRLVSGQPVSPLLLCDGRQDAPLELGTAVAGPLGQFVQRARGRLPATAGSQIAEELP